jgi:hypothetical protein
MSGIGMLEVLKRERISGMDQIITMSMKEMSRLKIVQRIQEDKSTVTEATESVYLCERLMYYVFARYCTKGEAGLVHRLIAVQVLIEDMHPRCGRKYFDCSKSSIRITTRHSFPRC